MRLEQEAAEVDSEISSPRMSPKGGLSDKEESQCDSVEEFKKYSLN